MKVAIRIFFYLDVYPLELVARVTERPVYIYTRDIIYYICNKFVYNSLLFIQNNPKG